jgi:predicted nucleic acid-binding protein
MSVAQISNFDIANYTSWKFVVDTNVLFFLHSGYWETDEKSRSYSGFIQDLLSKGLTVVVSAFTIQELLHSIENKEYKLYCRNNSLSEKSFTKKDFRKDPTLRENMQRKLSAVVAQLRGAYTIEDDCMQQNWLNEFVSIFLGHRYDPMDYVLVKSMLAKTKDTVFITDDTDFHADKNITVVTV